MKAIKFFIVAMICFLFRIPQPGFSQVKTVEKVYRLDRIIVRDHPLKDEAMFVTPDVTVINVDKFQKVGAVQNIRDLLSEVLGLTVLTSSITPSPTESIYIRGLDQSRIQVFLDGRPVRLMGRKGYIKVDWTTMPLDNVETIEIIRGRHSLLYPFPWAARLILSPKKELKPMRSNPGCRRQLNLVPTGRRAIARVF
ncbi:Plug domain-containing protein [bacterium]|nr:Plug domain-containing protein [bacterium]